VKTLRQLIFEETGFDHLDPVNVARDRKLRVLYEEWWQARGTPEEHDAYEAYKKFVWEEYCGDQQEQ
jgi:hypothetical protein